MTVGFLGAIRNITGVREQKVAAPTTVQGLLETMMYRYGDSWKEHVFDDKGLKPDVVVLVNGLNIQQMEGLSTSLAAVDRIDILPMFEGG